MKDRFSDRHESLTLRCLSWALIGACVVAFMAMYAHAQGKTTPLYTAIQETILSGAAESVTIQQPAASKQQVSFTQADIYCSVACTITASQNGSAATGTAVTGLCTANPCTSGIAQFPFSPPVQALMFKSSNVGTGEVFKTFYIPAAGVLSLDLSNFFLLKGSGGASNFTLTTNSITGTVRIQIGWTEQ